MAPKMSLLPVLVQYLYRYSASPLMVNSHAKTGAANEKASRNMSPVNISRFIISSLSLQKSETNAFGSILLTRRVATLKIKMGTFLKVMSFAAGDL
jgi:hypothetical protein